MTITTGICGVPKVSSFWQTYGNMKEDVKCLFFFSKKPLFLSQQKQPTQKKKYAEFHPVLKQAHWYHTDATATEKSNTQKKALFKEEVDDTLIYKIHREICNRVPLKSVQLDQTTK